MTILRFAVVAALAGTVSLGLFNDCLRAPHVEEYRPGEDGPDVVAQLEGLDRALDEGAAESMQEWFPEGYVFTWALYGLTWVQVGKNAPPESGRRARALAEARRAADAIDSPQGRAPFDRTTQPRWGVFYNGWLARLLGGILVLQRNRSEREETRFRELCDRIADALEASDSPYLSSYRGWSWPVDTVVAVSALRLHDDLYGDRYRAEVAGWTDAVRDSLDPETGLIPHRTDPATGETVQGARGSSQSLLLRFLIDIDPELARRHYRRFREQFADVRFGLVPGVREYPRGTVGPSDVDSGPIVFGFSAPANTVGAGTALAYGGRELAGLLFRGIEATGFPFSWGGSKRYAFGYLPVGEAFLVWSKTAEPWVADVPEKTPPARIRPAGWLRRWHFASLGVIFALWAPAALLWNRRRDGAD